EGGLAAAALRAQVALERARIDQDLVDLEGPAGPDRQHHRLLLGRLLLVLGPGQIDVERRALLEGRGQQEEDQQLKHDVDQRREVDQRALPTTATVAEVARVAIEQAQLWASSATGSLRGPGSLRWRARLSSSSPTMPSAF